MSPYMEGYCFIWQLYVCVFMSIYHCLHAESHLCFASIQTQTHHVNAPWAKQIGALCTRKACLGLVILKLKACLSVQPWFQEWGREHECCTEERGTSSKCCDFHSQGITQSLLSIPLNQETTGRKGRRIRLAREQGERKSGFSNPDGVCSGTPSIVEMRPVCCAELDLNGVGARQFASLNPLHLHERSSSKLGGLARV